MWIGFLFLIVQKAHSQQAKYLPLSNDGFVLNLSKVQTSFEKLDALNFNYESIWQVVPNDTGGLFLAEVKKYPKSNLREISSASSITSLTYSYLSSVITAKGQNDSLFLFIQNRLKNHTYQLLKALYYNNTLLILDTLTNEYEIDIQGASYVYSTRLMSIQGNRLFVLSKVDSMHDLTVFDNVFSSKPKLIKYKLDSVMGINHNLAMTSPRFIIPKNSEKNSFIIGGSFINRSNASYQVIAQLKFNGNKITEHQIIDTFNIPLGTPVATDDISRRNSSVMQKALTSYALSPNDSFLYACFVNYKFKKELLPPPYNVEAMLLRIDHTYTIRQYALYDKENFAKYKELVLRMPNVIDNNYTIFEECAPQQMRLAPDGKIYFINLKQKGPQYIGWIQKANELLQEKNIITQGIQIKPVPKYYYNLSKFAMDYTPYKKLRFLRSKTCTDYLQLFADADTFYKDFEWLVYTDSGTVDKQYFGKSLKHPVKGKNKFFVALRGISNTGYSVWTSDTISFNTKPKALFSADTSQWCQWVGLKMKNLSYSQYNNNEQFTWQILQDNKVERSFKGKEPFITFNKKGAFTVRLIYNNGTCTDTFTQSAVINIIEAPKPGFSLSDTLLCTPDTVLVTDLSVGKVVHRNFNWSDGFTDSSISHSRIFNKRQKIWIHQELLGPTGCITKDSQMLNVINSIDKYSLQFLASTQVIDSHLVALQWDKHPQAAAYKYSNQLSTQKLSIGTNNYLLDTVPQNSNKISYTYQITAIDSCGNSNLARNSLNTILLQANNYNNQTVSLNWTAHKLWPQGIKTYQIEYSYNNIDWLVLDQTAMLNLSPIDVKSQTIDSIYYRVLALSNRNPTDTSISNSKKVKLSNTLFIPNAFSPNNDGTNDVFSLSGIGISQLKCIIYGRNGQVISISDTPANLWDGYINGNKAPIGTYTYSLHVKFTDNTSTEFTGKVNLIE